MVQQLLDAQGRPIRRQALAEPVATGSLAGVRSVWQGAVAPGLTPGGLAGILRACDEGSLDAYLTLAEEMEERDPHYFSVLGMRKRAVSGVAPSVEPASDDARDVEIADAVREQIAEHDGFAGLVEDVLDGLGKGFSVVEILWRPEGSGWWIKGFESIDPRWFTYDRELGRELRLKDESNPTDGVPLEPGHFITYEARLKSGLAFRGGLARVAAFSWMCKAYTLKDWVAFVELYGLPLRLGRYGEQATKEDVQKLFSAVANIGTDAAAVLPESMKIEFIDATKGTGGEKIFEGLARWVDEQVSKAVLGQTMTADDGGSLAQAKVHDGVRHDIAKADARAVSAVLNRDLVKLFVDANYGVQQAYPRLSIQIAEPEDVELIVESVVKLAGLGMRFKASELYGNPATSDAVFTKDRFEHGIRYRCNGGYGFWQMAFCSKSALNAANFTAARAAMKAFTADGGRPLGINPNVLVVPGSLESAAENLIKKQALTGGESNVLFNAADVIVSPWL